jgi:Zn-dependent protease
LFWLIAILFASSSNLFTILLWVIAIFISILIHEMGHALAFRRFGQPSHILLHFAGGLTIPQSISLGSYNSTVGLSPNQHIFVSLAGPGAGFLLATLVVLVSKLIGGLVAFSTILWIIPFPMVQLPGPDFVTSFAMMLLWVNIFWGIINLVPVWPLDGGQVARFALLQSDPWDGVRKSLWLSVISGGILAFIGLFVFRSIYTAFLFGMLAFQSYQSLQGRYGSGY